MPFQSQLLLSKTQFLKCEETFVMPGKIVFSSFRNEVRVSRSVSKM